MVLVGGFGFLLGTERRLQLSTAAQISDIIHIILVDFLTVTVN